MDRLGKYVHPDPDWVRSRKVFRHVENNTHECERVGRREDGMTRYNDVIESYTLSVLLHIYYI